MKFHPPTLQIDEKEPFQHSLFGRKEFARSLTSLLRHSEENLVIFVDGTWGTGKTTFTKMWLAQLRADKQDAIYYNAYASDYFGDPFVSFSGEILALVKKRLAESDGIPAEREAFTKSAVAISKRLVGVGVRVGLKAATLGALGADETKELGEISAELVNGATASIGAEIEMQLRQYTKEKDALTVFKTNLARLAKRVREEQGFPLTIIVDELDRCRPTFALGLLERIKHLFDVENVAFVLFLSRQQIENYVRTVYGPGDETARYLLKFGSVFVSLPDEERNIDRFGSYRDRFCERLYEHFQLPCRDDGVVLSLIQIVASHFSLTLRDIERLFTALALYFGSTPRADGPDFAVVLAAVRIKFPALYAELCNRDVAWTDFLKVTHLGDVRGMRRGIDGDYIHDNFMLALANDEEWASLPKDTQEKLDHRYDRQWTRNLLPRVCGDLNRFSLGDVR